MIQQKRGGYSPIHPDLISLLLEATKLANIKCYRKSHLVWQNGSRLFRKIDPHTLVSLPPRKYFQMERAFFLSLSPSALETPFMSIVQVPVSTGAFFISFKTRNI
jgi:hypothetical protein